MKKCAKIGKSKSLTALTRRLTDPQSIDRFIRVGNFKRLPHFFFMHCSPPFFRVFLVLAFRD